jgi:hypothetical protein
MNGSNLLQRSKVPAHFPQFRSVAALAHLAHLGRGPRYVLVGGIAWYDPADINQWLENNKTTGPAKAKERQVFSNAAKRELHGTGKRGRPTKLEQMLRRRLSSDASNR